MLRAGLIQLNSSDDPVANLPQTVTYMRGAAKEGATFVLTPEVTNCVSASRSRQQQVLHHETDDPTLAALRREAEDLGVWLLIGSLAVKTDDPDGRFANRSFLVSPEGGIVARYDKMHMFDVEISESESYRESAGYRPGRFAVAPRTPFARVGMTVCYDLRFPRLYRHLAQAGADILTVPSAFSPVSGAAHWETLLRARAIETGCFVLAPAQCGTHDAQEGKARQTYGHSLAVSPWGEVLADGGDAPGVVIVDVEMSEVAEARGRIPSLGHDRPIEGPFDDEHVAE
ncbi:carbon-nitrogen hydrolase family protein [Roseovarius sp. SCSIO 43702]|uniref:carbon-nitrogen hydrolase family protein n=1 Tax=Roseovarius sp. SCSIO 43702 TaxID=2823043 RepID=UPI001C72B455|nr:carbon-nitrogen hydrolase family protein [Roseovarius sp. SCSIO 43702]QYX57025.1 carbon-nitrogen hydrolase family protein [Roseovarius sp. SCSIO 43702]